MSDVFCRIINPERTYFLELYYDGFDRENPLEHSVCTVDLWRRGDCWVGSDPEWDNYKGVCSQGISPDDKEYVRSLKNIIKMGGVVLPVFCYCHSGITFRCSSFNDPWDSGQAGYAYLTTEQISELGWPKGKRGRKAAAEEYIRQMVGLVAAYANGDIYGFTIFDKDGEFVDGCGGYYASHYGEDNWIEQMKYDSSEEFHPLFDEYYPGRGLDDLEYTRRIPQEN